MKAGSEQRFLYLDCLRGISAILILLCHYGDIVAHERLIGRIYLAVDMFFVLGGFVSGYAYERRLLTTMSWSEFASRRLIRLVPLYILGLVLGGFSIVMLFHPNAAELRGLGMAFVAGALILPYLSDTAVLGDGPGLPDAFPLNPPSWALTYEIYVGLIYGAVARYMSNAWLMATIGASGLLYSIYVMGSDGYFLGSWARDVVPGIFRVSFSFFMGVLIFRLFRPDKALPKWAPIVLTVGLYAILAIPMLPRGNRLVDLPILLFVLPGVVYLGARCNIPARFEKFVAFSGDLAFPIYMLHFPIMKATADYANSHHLPPLETAALGLVAGAFVVMLSIVALKFYDAPVRRWLVGLTSPKRAAAMKAPETRAADLMKEPSRP